MKKILLCFLVSASLFACTNQETKKAENSEEDKDTGTWTSLDAKTIKVRELLEIIRFRTMFSLHNKGPTI